MKRTRRAVLGGCAALVTGGSAGCLELSGGSSGTGEEDNHRNRSEPTDPEPTEAEPTGTESDPEYEAVYEAVSPSVVRIQTYVEQLDGFVDGGGEAGSGSGFLYDSGTLVTNDHVLGDADTVRAQTADGTWLETTVVGRDPYSDLAVLETEGPVPGTPLSLADPTPPIGTEVMVVGSPLGLRGTATTGIVSGRNRTIPASSTADGAFSIADAVQTDAALNQGNSGGPIVTLDGEVVGVATATQGENVGFGVSAPLVREVVPELIATGSYDHSYMGIQVLEVEPLLASANDLPEARGVYVADTVLDGPADGVLLGTNGETTVEGATVPVGGDTIVGLNDTPIAADADLSRFLALETRPGDTIAVTVRRNGRTETVDLELGARPEP